MFQALTGFLSRETTRRRTSVRCDAPKISKNEVTGSGSLAFAPIPPVGRELFYFS